jgi:ABC-type molybdate transport system ATPase subunit
MDAVETEALVEGFIVRFSDEIAAEIRSARTIMRARLQALAKARVKLDPGQDSHTIVKSISAKQRPRRRA